MSNRLKVWFNEDRGFYEVFLPDGTLINQLLQVRVSDNFRGGAEIPTAVFTCLVDVVNQKPEKISDEVQG